MPRSLLSFTETWHAPHDYERSHHLDAFTDNNTGTAVMKFHDERDNLSTIEDPDWNNTTVLKGDVVTEVMRLKQKLDGEIVVPGSIQLVRTLMEHNLVDELRLMIYPVVLGAGERLFVETTDKKPLRLVASQILGEGIAFLTYAPVVGA